MVDARVSVEVRTPTPEQIRGESEARKRKAEIQAEQDRRSSLYTLAEKVFLSRSNLTIDEAYDLARALLEKRSTV